jgi:ABC-type dipeptide/oligopeptide/nickel transport system permease component
MDRPLSAVSLTIGVVLGIAVGIAYAMARRAWRDYKVTKDSLTGLKKTAWGLLRIAFTRGGLVILLCLAAMGWAAVGKS